MGFGGFHGAGGAGHQLIDGGAMGIVGGLGFGHGGGEAGGLGQGGQEAGLHHLEETAAGGDDGAIQRLAQVGAQLWLGRPVGFAFGEFAREAGEAVQQGGTGGGFGGSQFVQGEQTFDDVEWRREDIGSEVGAGDIGIKCVIGVADRIDLRFGRHLACGKKRKAGKCQGEYTAFNGHSLNCYPRPVFCPRWFRHESRWCGSRNALG